MQENKHLVYPVLAVTINGTESKQRPACFRLITDRGIPSLLAELDYPSDCEDGKSGDTLSISLVEEAEPYLLFTGIIYDAQVHGAYRKLRLTDGYKQLCDTPVTPAYRKEKAQVIVQDTLDAAKITDTALTCPAVEIARFSTVRISADTCIALLINALIGYGYTGIRYFFDVHNTFCFGAFEDTGKNKGEPYTFETRKNILRTGPGWIEILPCPIRHSQKIRINDTDVITLRTDLMVSQRRSRLKMWVGEA
jgi:hypothetical protein